MQRLLLLLGLVGSSTLAGGSPSLADAPPGWAYPVNPPGLTESPDDNCKKKEPG